MFKKIQILIVSLCSTLFQMNIRSISGNIPLDPFKIHGNWYVVAVAHKDDSSAEFAAKSWIIQISVTSATTFSGTSNYFDTKTDAIIDVSLDGIVNDSQNIGNFDVTVMYSKDSHQEQIKATFFETYIYTHSVLKFEANLLNLTYLIVSHNPSIPTYERLIIFNEYEHVEFVDSSCSLYNTVLSTTELSTDPFRIAGNWNVVATIGGYKGSISLLKAACWTVTISLSSPISFHGDSIYINKQTNAIIDTSFKGKYEKGKMFFGKFSGSLIDNDGCARDVNQINFIQRHLNDYALVDIDIKQYHFYSLVISRRPMLSPDDQTSLEELAKSRKISIHYVNNNRSSACPSNIITKIQQLRSKQPRIRSSRECPSNAHRVSFTILHFLFIFMYVLFM